MRILILNWRDTRNPLSGGAELVTLEHAKAWVAAGHSVTWLSSKFHGALSREILDGITIVRHGSDKTIRLIAPLYYLLLKSRFEVVVDEIHGLPFFTPLYVHIPKLAFIHEIADDIWDYMYPFPLNKFGKLLERLSFRIYRNVRFWTDSNSTIDELVNYGIARSNCVAISCPIIPTDYVSLIQKYAKDVVPTYIFVSRLVRMKGIEEILKAFSFILKEQEDAQLWIVGGGDVSYVERLHKMLEEYGIEAHVKFLGKVNNVKKFMLMQKSHILLHASVKEGWGLVVLESASVGTPSVVYNIPGLRDVVKNGKTGIVVSVNSPQELAREALMLYMDKRKYKLFQKNGKKWVQSLRWEDVTKQSLSLLQEVVDFHRKI